MAYYTGWWVTSIDKVGLCVSSENAIMCCCLVRRRKRKKPPSLTRSSARTRSSSHGYLPSSSRASASTFPSSSATDFSSSSTSSIASIREIVSDGLHLYRFPEISAATGNFDPARKVGRSVWKAVLHDTVVAVSRKQGRARRFHSALSRVRALHHQNIVKLLGACHEGGYLYLVYEFMESSSLRDCLRSKHGVSFSALSSWQSRLQVAFDVAKGLEYLHHLASPALIHKFVDSRNVLVGNDLRAKIAHVGVSVLTGEVEFQKVKWQDNGAKIPENDMGEIQPISRDDGIARSSSIKINGIQGYMPPEYLNFGEVTCKYDVFAFGVILGEILSGKEAIFSSHDDSKEGTPRQHVKSVSMADSLLSVMTGNDSKSKLRRWMDPLLKDAFPLDNAHKVASIAVACMDPDPLKRPDMSYVGLHLHKLLLLAEKYDASIRAGQGILTASLQPR